MKFCLFVLLGVFAAHLPAVAQTVAADGNASAVLKDQVLWRTLSYPGPDPLSAEREWLSVAATSGVDPSGQLWQWLYHLERVGTDANWQYTAVTGRSYFAIKSDGSLWAWGYGELGDGFREHLAAPIRIGTATGWSTVAGGLAHRLALRTDGSLWAWGNNSHGNLGDGTTTYRAAPVRIGILNTWIAVAATDHGSQGLQADGSLWAWGGGPSGNDSAIFQSSVPVRIGTQTDWTMIRAGGNFVIARKNDGSIWGWGTNDVGQLGLGDTTDRRSPVQIGTANDWRSFAAGTKHVIASRADGSIWGWGSNSNQQLGFEGSTVLSPMNLTLLFNPKPVLLAPTSNGYPVTPPWYFPVAALGESVTASFEIRNAGAAPLTISSVTLPAGLALVYTPGVVPPLTTATVTLRIEAISAGPISGTVRIVSTDPATPELGFAILSRVLSPEDDTDEDGLNDAVELTLAPLGFRWDSRQSTELLSAGAAAAGFYHTNDIATLRATGHLDQQSLKLDLRNAAGQPVPLSPSHLTPRAGNLLELSLPLPVGKRFLQVR